MASAYPTVSQHPEMTVALQTHLSALLPDSTPATFQSRLIDWVKRAPPSDEKLLEVFRLAVVNNDACVLKTLFQNTTFQPDEIHQMGNLANTPEILALFPQVKDSSLHHPTFHPLAKHATEARKAELAKGTELLDAVIAQNPEKIAPLINSPLCDLHLFGKAFVVVACRFHKLIPLFLSSPLFSKIPPEHLGNSLLGATYSNYLPQLLECPSSEGISPYIYSNALVTAFVHKREEAIAAFMKHKVFLDFKKENFESVLTDSTQIRDENSIRRFLKEIAGHPHVDTIPPSIWLSVFRMTVSHTNPDYAHVLLASPPFTHIEPGKLHMIIDATSCMDPESTRKTFHTLVSAKPSSG